MTRTFVLTMICLLMAESSALAGKGLKSRYPSKKEARQASIAQLRQQGPRGLETALRALKKVEDSLATVDSSEKLEAALGRLATCKNYVDQIAGQRYAHVSRLYWYTDMKSAQAAAAKSGKPILSLRMLGNLTDEYSCANSRFVRTALYANKEVSGFMRENFVLHWQSVRPAPRVTIDFGDGRKIERTITGNSAHHVLTATGQPLDVLPGLYVPSDFMAWLGRVQTLAADYQSAEDQAARSAKLRQYHLQRHQAIRENWKNDIAQVAPELLEHRGRLEYAFDKHGNTTGYGGLVYVDVFDAGHRARSKARPEIPILLAMRVHPHKTDRMVTGKLWQRLAEMKRADVKLDPQSIELMRQMNPTALQAGNFAVTKSASEDPIARVVRSFQDSMALDTVRNEYLLHRQIHLWFLDKETPTNVNQLNERVYAELFLTPSSDPWLGLAPPDVFTALQDGGLRVATQP